MNQFIGTNLGSHFDLNIDSLLIMNHAEIVHSGKESDLTVIVLNIILILNHIWMIYQFGVTT